MLLKPIKAVLIAAVFLVAGGTHWIVRALSAPAGRTAGGASAFFEVGKGWSTRAVLDHLGREGLVRDPLPLRLACRIFYPEERFKAGEYLFSPPLPAKAALFRIFGARVHLELLTVPEGLTGDEIAALLRPDDAEGMAVFRRAVLDPGPIADLDPRAHDLEGYLFPETYNLPRQASGADIVAAMVARFHKVFDRSRRRRAAELGLSVREVVILASLIEKETALPAERPLVSAVFHNRLKIGMKLDCDPTVVYALKREGLYKGRLLLKDLTVPSPYNTYLHAGLPPGPIANPGLASLDAALYPSSAAYLYFVARGDGSHRFSRTLGEHLEAVKKYRALQIR
jgi:UPF0755 protein